MSMQMLSHTWCIFTFRSFRQCHFNIGVEVRKMLPQNDSYDTIAKYWGQAETELHYPHKIHLEVKMLLSWQVAATVLRQTQL